MTFGHGSYIDYPRWPQLAREAYSLDLSHVRENVPEYVEGIVISGMGGSGIVGDIVRDYLTFLGYDKPVIVVKDLQLPKFVANRKFLVVTVSYSGNTTETIRCLEECIRRNIPVVTVSTGGKLEELARQHSVPHVKIPKATAPRYGLPCLLYPTLRVVELVERSLASKIREHVEASIKAIEEAIEDYLTHVKELSRKLVNKLAMIYVPQPLISIGIRFKNDMNENAKQPVVVCPLPESEHNDIAIHARKHDFLEVVLVRSRSLAGTEYEKHVNAVEQILRQYGVDIHALDLKGGNVLAEIMYGITLLGMLTIDVAHLAGIDPVKIEVIDNVKKYVSK